MEDVTLGNHATWTFDHAMAAETEPIANMFQTIPGTQAPFDTDGSGPANEVPVTDKTTPPLTFQAIDMGDSRLEEVQGQTKSQTR
jgi:hypothetical protein